jgi:lysozyme
MADLKDLALKTIAGVLGSAAAAAMVLTTIPAEESGRKVAVTIAPTGQATIRHISGPQYLRAYLDAVKVPTACDGLTRGVKMGQTFTEAQCSTKLQAELIDISSHVIDCVPGLYGRTNQVSAAVSLAYNIGWPSFCRSTAARRFNAGRWSAGCDAFTMWNKAGGKVLAGLVTRRRRERALCLTGLAA